MRFLMLMLLLLPLTAATAAPPLRAPWRTGDVWRVRVWDELNLPAYGRLVPAKRVTDARFEVSHTEPRCGEAIQILSVSTRGGEERKFEMAVQQATGDLWEIRECLAPRRLQRKAVRILPRTAPFIAPDDFPFFHLFDSPRLAGPEFSPAQATQTLSLREPRGHRRLTLTDERRKIRIDYIFHPDCPWWTRAAWYRDGQLVRLAVLLNSDRFRAADRRRKQR